MSGHSMLMLDPADLEIPVVHEAEAEGDGGDNNVKADRVQSMTSLFQQKIDKWKVELIETKNLIQEQEAAQADEKIYEDHKGEPIILLGDCNSSPTIALKSQNNLSASSSKSDFSPNETVGIPPNNPNIHKLELVMAENTFEEGKRTSPAVEPHSKNAGRSSVAALRNLFEGTGSGTSTNLERQTDRNSEHSNSKPYLHNIDNITKDIVQSTFSKHEKDENDNAVEQRTRAFPDIYNEEKELVDTFENEDKDEEESCKDSSVEEFPHYDIEKEPQTAEQLSSVSVRTLRSKYSGGGSGSRVTVGMARTAA